MHSFLLKSISGKIKTVLTNLNFDTTTHLIETRSNINIFEIDITLKLTSKTLEMGDWYEIQFICRSTSCDTNKKVILKCKID